MVMKNLVINMNVLSVTANTLPQKVMEGFRNEIMSKIQGSAKENLNATVLELKNNVLNDLQNNIDNCKSQM